MPSQRSTSEKRLATFWSHPVDVGRRSANRPVTVSILLRYNHQAELYRFVDRLATTPHARYLTQPEFIARYGPTPQQEIQVVRVLQRAGFRIAQRFANRQLIDAFAPSAVVEHFFATEIHDFRQPRYGLRFANVRPLRIPPALATLVSSATADTTVRMHPGSSVILSGAPEGRAVEGQPDNSQAIPDIVPPSDFDVHPSGSNAVGNGGFETGHLKPWKTCDTTNTNRATVQKVRPHSGRFDAYAGTYTGQSEPQGITSVCQVVTIPAGAQINAWVMPLDNDKSTKVFAFGAFFNSSGHAVKTLYITRKTSTWENAIVDLSALRGQRLLLAFGVQGNKFHHGKVVGQFVDDVWLGSGTAPSPSPTPPPPAAPCPSAPAPTPTPDYAATFGWGPEWVNAGFCMPVNYGYPGTGQTAAIVIDATVDPQNLSDYLQYFHINHTGTVTNVAVDGGGSTDMEGEATLDLETVAALAPGANVLVYDMPDLSFQHILDAYNKVVSDNLASVVNSSFSGCEDTQFSPMTDAIAVGAAATGITFSASSDDQGAGCYNGSTPYPFGVGAPASDPHFVGVGGTESNAPAAAGPYGCGDYTTDITNPQVWRDCAGAGGGGISVVWTPPPWQTGIPGASAAGRNVPDIALPAAYDDILFTSNGLYETWSIIWGTSWSSPMYVAMQTDINQACGKAWGMSTIYGARLKSGYKHFIDVTMGNNKNVNGKGSYSATTGFDNVSGIGMPLGIGLAEDECSAPLLRRR
jgi:hypothetical protein